MCVSLTRSRCIIQGDPEDWEREAARMRDIYSQAIFCIAATAAKDSTMGLFFDRDPQGLLPMGVETTRNRIYGQKTNEPLIAYTIQPEVFTPEEVISTAPLNKRAWVAQERYLSTGIIHFTQELLYWECHETMTSEQGPSGDHKSRSHYRLRGFMGQILKWEVNDDKIKRTSELPGTIGTGHEDLSEYYRYWCNFRASYSGFHLTKDKDILVALNGVAQDVAEVMNDALVAGLWRSRLIEDMCWVRRSTANGLHPTDTTPRSAVWRAPTWSWASINHSVERWTPWSGENRTSEPTFDMAVIEALRVHQKPSGELVNASMTLRCRPILISPPKSAAVAWEDYYDTMCFDDFTSSGLDFLAHKVSLVILRHCCYGLMGEGYVQGILLSPSRVKIGSYERVGCFHFEADSEMFIFTDFDNKTRMLQRVLEAYHAAEERAIELI